MNYLLGALFFVYRYVLHFLFGFFKALWDGFTKIKGPLEFGAFMMGFLFTWWFRSGQMAFNDTQAWLQKRRVA